MHDRPAHDQRLTAMRSWNQRTLFFSPVVFWTLGHVVRTFPAVHMTWGAINEWTANAAYNRLAKIADHPVLTELLGRIMRQEGRHAGYYAVGRSRPARRSRKAQKVTSWFLRHQWDAGRQRRRAHGSRPRSPPPTCSARARAPS